MELILSFNNHIRRSDGAVVRSARDVRLPQVPEASIGSHRQRIAPLVYTPTIHKIRRRAVYAR